MAVDVHRAFSVGFFLVVVFYVAAVAGDFGQAQQAGLFGQHFVDGVNAHAQGVVQMEDDCRIDIAGAGTHHQAFQRGQTHGGVNAFAVTNSGNRTTVAKVAGDDVQLFNRLVQDLSGFLSHVEVAGAVCAVTTNAVLFVQAVRQGVEIGFFRHGLVERRIEYCHVFVFQVREGFQRFSDADQMCRVVQRCEGRRVFNALNHGLVDDDGAGVFFTAVDDTVANCGQLSRQFWFLCQNSVNDKVQCFAVRGARA